MHPNADKLVIIEIMGWQVVTAKETNPQVGDLRVFIPPDAVLPDELAKELEVEKYLKKGNRVGQVKLRGEMSFGIAVNNRWGFEVGQEVSQELGITKWIPPVIPQAGDQEQDHPLFSNYSRIENWRNYPDVIQEGEIVYYFEKIHGTNSKVGLIKTDIEGPLGSTTYEFMVGSHNTRRKLINPERDDYKKKVSLYQYPLDKVEGLLTAVQTHFSAKVVIVYGEIFGRVQDLKYDRPNELDYRAFDLYVDGKFLDWAEANNWFDRCGVDAVPVLHYGPHSESVMKRLANQNTVLTINNPHISEGIVIRPDEERTDPELGRVILKYKSDAYEERYARGKGTEYS